MLRTSSALWLVRQSREASTAIVIGSSSQLAIERSPLARAAQACGEPLVGVVDCLTVEAQARHIGPVGHDSDHRFSSSNWSDGPPAPAGGIS